VGDRDGGYIDREERGKAMKDGNKCKKNNVIHHNKITCDIVHYKTVPVRVQGARV
jgi:hypothetical protein